MRENGWEDIPRPRRQGKIPPANDLLIAATVVAHDKVLITLDRDFLLFKDYGLKVELLSG